MFREWSIELSPYISIYYEWKEVWTNIRLGFSEGGSFDESDRLSKISPLLIMLIKKFQTSYSPSTNLSLDESMMLWRGWLIFRQYIKNKRHKYGIKFYELCTTDGYVLSAEIYKGKNVENTSSSKVNDLVLRLMRPYLNRGHHLFMDNFLPVLHWVKFYQKIKLIQLVLWDQIENLIQFISQVKQSNLRKETSNLLEKDLFIFVDGKIKEMFL